jgi:transposase-like protein
METRIVNLPRRRYSAEFKKEVVLACCEPNVSIARVALHHGLNANFAQTLGGRARRHAGESHGEARRGRPPAGCAGICASSDPASDRAGTADTN